jgi:hypothetical protein
MGTNVLKQCTVRKKIFYTGTTRAAKAKQKMSCTGTTGPTYKPSKDPFNLSSLSPIHLYFNSQQGPLVFLVETKEREIRKKDDKVYMYNSILKGPSGQIRSALYGTIG